MSAEAGTRQGVVLHVRTTVMDLEHPMSMERKSFDNTIQYIQVWLWRHWGMKFRNVIKTIEMYLY